MSGKMEVEDLEKAKPFKTPKGYGSHECKSHHCHNYSGASVKSLTWAFFLVLFYFAVEVVGGLASNSLTLLTDSCHVLTDVAAVGLALFAAYFTNKQGFAHNQPLTFGYHRLEVIFALVITVFVWGLSALIMYEGVQRFNEPVTVNGPLVMLVAAIGVAVNGVVMLLLRHNPGNSLNIRAVFLHSLGDFLANGAVLASGFLIWLTKMPIIDPIVNILAAAFVIGSSVKLFRDIIYILMERCPDNITPYNIYFELKRFPGVEEVHELHVWSLKPGYPLISVHLVVKDQVVKQHHGGVGRLREKVQDLLLEQFGVEHATIQIERDGIDRLCKTKLCLFLR